MFVQKSNLIHADDTYFYSRSKGIGSKLHYVAEIFRLRTHINLPQFVRNICIDAVYGKYFQTPNMLNNC